MHLGNNKEVFDIKVHVNGSALRTASWMVTQANPRRVEIFTDSQSSLKRAGHSTPGPGTSLAMRAIHWKRAIYDKGSTVEYHWVPGHQGITGNEKADEAAKRVAKK